jgi:hypothetical protein
MDLYALLINYMHSPSFNIVDIDKNNYDAL